MERFPVMLIYIMYPHNVVAIRAKRELLKL